MATDKRYAQSRGIKFFLSLNKPEFPLSISLQTDNVHPTDNVQLTIVGPSVVVAIFRVRLPFVACAAGGERDSTPPARFIWSHNTRTPDEWTVTFL
jgi:hypothetical protein